MAVNIVIASFDVGRKNFAQYVEKVPVKKIRQLRSEYASLPYQERRRVKGYMSKCMEKILNDVTNCGERLEMGVYDLCTTSDPDPPYDMGTRWSLVRHLESFRHIWDQCDVFLIEQQYFSTFTPKGRKQKGTEANVKAIKVGEGVLMWFMIHYPDREVLYFGSQFKTQILGAPASLTKSQRKSWSIKKAKEIFEKRGDADALEQFRKTKKSGQKLDDVSDALTQCQAYKFRCLVAEF
jgi:hypothetical protein